MGSMRAALCQASDDLRQKTRKSLIYMHAKIIWTPYFYLSFKEH